MVFSFSTIMPQNRIQTKEYLISKNITLNNEIINNFNNQFWNDVYKPLKEKNPDIYLNLMVKLNYNTEINNSSVKSLGQMRIVGFESKNLYIAYLQSKLGVLQDAYTSTPFNSIIFTFIVRDGEKPEDSDALLKEPIYQCSAHTFNNAKLPLSMDPRAYGEIISTIDNGSFIKYIIKNEHMVFEIDKYPQYSIVEILGITKISWIDISDVSIFKKVKDIVLKDVKSTKELIKSSNNSILNNDIPNRFTRKIGNNIIYIENGEIFFKEKLLNAQPIKKIKKDDEIIDLSEVMTVDIETYLNENKHHKPYLICGATTDTTNPIIEFISEPTDDGENKMFSNFISEIIFLFKYFYNIDKSIDDNIVLTS